MGNGRNTSTLTVALLALASIAAAAGSVPAGADDEMVYQPGAEFYFYAGKWSPKLAIAKLKPVYKRVILNQRPAVDLSKDPDVPKGDYFVVSRGFLRVDLPYPARQITLGYGASTYCVMTLDGKEIYRKGPGAKEATYTEMYLSRGYHPFEIVWFGNRTHFTNMYGESGGGGVWHKAPFTRQMQTELLGAFAALKKHLTGAAKLPDDQIDAHKEKL